MNTLLAGKRIVVTRAKHQSIELINKLEVLGAEVISFPTIEIIDPSSWKLLDNAIKHIEQYDWIFFTSANGLEYFYKRLKHYNIEVEVFRNLKICAIGSSTSRVASTLNIRVDLIPEKFTAEGVIQAFLKLYDGKETLIGKRVLLPRAKIAREVLITELLKVGVQIDAVEAYQTICPKYDVSQWEVKFKCGVDVIIFTSASTVNNFAKIFASYDLPSFLQGITIACIGPITAEAVQEQGLTVNIQPNEYTTTKLIECISDFYEVT